MLEQIKEKIASIEAQIQTTIAQHSYLAGALAALKEAVTIGEAVAPTNPVVAGLAEAEHVAELVEAELAPVEPAQ